LIGVGVLMAIDPGPPTSARPEVQLTSFASLLAPPPLTPSTTTPWWLGGGNDTGGGLFGASIAPNALIAEVGGGGAGFNIFNPFGPGGWLIGNGLDAQAGCVGAACPCGSGGILFGNGGGGGQGGTGTNGAGGGDKGTDDGQGGVGGVGGGAPSA
jgi:hypothetical protein